MIIDPRGWASKHGGTLAGTIATAQWGREQQGTRTPRQHGRLRWRLGMPEAPDISSELTLAEDCWITQAAVGLAAANLVRQERAFRRRVLGIEPMRTAFRCPGRTGSPSASSTHTRELLDHVIVLNEPHLQHLLSQLIDYYQVDRPHLALGKDSPVGCPVEPRPSPATTVIALSTSRRAPSPLRLAPGGVAPRTRRPLPSSSPAPNASPPAAGLATGDRLPSAPRLHERERSSPFPVRLSKPVGPRSDLGQAQGRRRGP